MSKESNHHKSSSYFCGYYELVIGGLVEELLYPVVYLAGLEPHLPASSCKRICNAARLLKKAGSIDDSQAKFVCPSTIIACVWGAPDVPLRVQGRKFPTQPYGEPTGHPTGHSVAVTKNWSGRTHLARRLWLLQVDELSGKRPWAASIPTPFWQIASLQPQSPNFLVSHTFPRNRLQIP